MPLSQGQTLDKRYRIVKLLGQGGFGVVYRVWDTRLETPRALKENLDTSPKAQRQFKREAQILDKLTHPSLPKVIDHFIISDQGQYLVMEYIDGEDLKEMLQRAGDPLPEPQVLKWIGQVCDALEYLHTQNPPVIHRDIKPANIKITPEGNAMLVDFGIAKVGDPDARTSTGAQALSPGYSPPEQYGLERTDAQSDVFALGATTYHLLTGEAPPPAMHVMAGIAPEPEPAQALNPAVSEGVSAAVERAMQFNRAERSESVAVFKQDLLAGAAPSFDPGGAATIVQTRVHETRAARTPAPAVPPGQTVALPVSRTWPRWLGALVLAIVLVLVGVLLGGGLFRRDNTPTNSGLAPQSTSSTALLLDASPQTSPPTNLTPAASSTLTTGLFTSTVAEPPDITREYRLTERVSILTERASTHATGLTPEPSPLPEQITDDYGVTMALVPAGPFEMGVADGDSGGGNLHTVTLDDYYFDIYEVTNAAYARCVADGGCEPPMRTVSYSRDSYYGNPAYDDYPVIYVTWFMANEFCEWRGARLPTEAEWEKAARGGLESKMYSWGDEDPDCTRANFWEQESGCVADTSQVGSYPSNGYGLYDTIGNVMEWANDWYAWDYYENSPSENPTGPETGENRILRGGSWDNFDFLMRVDRRTTYIPSDGLNTIGFRCARSP